MNIEITEQEREVLIQLIAQVTIRGGQPDAVLMAQICQSLLNKLNTTKTS